MDAKVANITKKYFGTNITDGDALVRAERGIKMIDIKLNGWDEEKLQAQIVDKVAQEIIRNEGFYFDSSYKDGYTVYDKFKNLVANLVADRIFEHLVKNEEIQKRIDRAINNAEKTIVSKYMQDLEERQEGLEYD